MEGPVPRTDNPDNTHRLPVHAAFLAGNIARKHAAFNQVRHARGFQNNGVRRFPFQLRLHPGAARLLHEPAYDLFAARFHDFRYPPQDGGALAGQGSRPLALGIAGALVGVVHISSIRPGDLD